MNKPLRFSFLLLGAVVPGIAIGWWLAPASPDSSGLMILQNPRSPKHLDQLRRDKAITAVAALSAPDAVDPQEGDEVERFLNKVDESGMRIIPVDSLRHLEIQAIRSGTVADEMREMLSLTPEEAERVNVAIQTSGDALRDAELERLEIVDVSETEAVFRVPALGETGEKVAVDFREEIKAALGDVDGAIFLAIMGDGHISYWDGFGRHDRTITFSVQPRDDGRVWLEFSQENDVEQVREHYAGRGIRRSGTSGGGRSLGTIFPYPAGRPSPPRRSLQRSVYLLPLLPEELRFYFEEMENGN